MLRRGAGAAQCTTVWHRRAREHIHIHTYICMYVCIYIYIYIYIYIHMCVCLSLSLYIYIYTHTCISLSLSIYIYIYIYICIHATRCRGMIPASGKSTPPEKNTLGIISLKNTKSRAGELYLLKDSRTKARAEGVFCSQAPV